MLNNINISSKRQKLIIYAFLTFFTLAVFWQLHQSDFINIDDNIYVTENDHIKSRISLENFIWAFSTTHAEFWHPLTLLSLMLDYKFYGLNAGGYHLTNLILHILSTLLLFWFFNRMTKEIWKSAFVAALFALHPLHVESVAWISERKDVLSAFFWMLTLCFYVLYTEKPVIGRYLLVVLSFIFALMSKPMVVTLPLIMILLDYWPLERMKTNKGNWLLWQFKEKFIFFFLSIIISTITIYAQQNLPKKLVPLTYRIANAPVTFVSYLEKMFWPNDMAFIYPMSEQISYWHTCGALLMILIISVFVIISAKKLPYFFVGWFWYTITILPVLGIINTGLYWKHDLYTYLPSIGIAIIMSWAMPSFLQNENYRKKLLFSMAIIYLAIIIILAWQQCNFWKNSISLFKHSLQLTKNSSLAHYNYGLALFSEGKIEEAINQYDKAIQITPNVDVYFNRGLAYEKINHYQNAVNDFTSAIHLKPDYVTFYKRGNIYYNTGQYQKAIQDYSEAIRLKHDYAEAYNNRGNIYGQIRQYQLAINDFNRIIGINPHFIKAYNNRGLAYSELGENEKAIKDFSTAINLKQDYAIAYNNRASVYLKQNHKEMACNDARKACSLGACSTLHTAKTKRYCD